MNKKFRGAWELITGAEELRPAALPAEVIERYRHEAEVEEQREAYRKERWSGIHAALGQLTGRLFVVTNFHGHPIKARWVARAIASEPTLDHDDPIIVTPQYDSGAEQYIRHDMGLDSMPYTESARALSQALIFRGFSFVEQGPDVITDRVGGPLDALAFEAQRVIEFGEAHNFNNVGLVAVTSALNSDQLGGGLTYQDSYSGSAYVLEGVGEAEDEIVWRKIASRASG
jgi:hypothetical protein